jgi:hypothetical protein
MNELEAIRRRHAGGRDSIASVVNDRAYLLGVLDAIDEFTRRPESLSPEALQQLRSIFGQEDRTDGRQPDGMYP